MTEPTSTTGTGNPGPPHSRLAISGLTISFGSTPTVYLDSLTVGDGEIVGLAGESGAGKSLTGLSVLGLTPRMGAWLTGSIRLDGRELLTLPERELRRLRGGTMALIPQSPASAFNPLLRVGTVITRALRLHGDTRAQARQRAEAALERVRLSKEHLRRYPHQLSGGQLQRVAIALALALGARFLIADEPTSALDVTVQAEILQLLERLRAEEGLSILMVSHDLAALAGLCDRIVVMRDGRVVEDRPTLELVTSPNDPYTEELIDAVPQLGPAPGPAEAGRAGTDDA
ncbi:ABC transporter ATP-binding protein [Lipingzhangella sp. LS1_29]|uniref:ABC transporter ATP-binding protein n=1 Tax=Lipingzhangella rawalii TaxID=2055835 RepID=A0ABU2H3X8_9ACTN|nr:ABC transporter ATP-binding protein [Lipingzhangella rawalii]MDS1269559.1 ABC transporter ATP-binding protein [Lipingzhangella rawalii]